MAAAAAWAAPGISGAPGPPPFLPELPGDRGAEKTRSSLASERRARCLLLQPGRLPCSFSSSQETGWNSASAPQGRQDAARRARASSGKDHGSLGSRPGSHFGAPPPQCPRAGGRGGARLPGPLRAKALRVPRWHPRGQPAGPARTACTLQSSREASQRETRGAN